MADIVLAEHSGQAWLVSGEEYIDDLLGNTLPSHVSIEFVACASRSDVNLLWTQNCGQLSESTTPWMINPAIVSRIRGVSAEHSVFFAQWSAQLDSDAHSTIRASAARAAQYTDSAVMLVSYLDPDGQRMLSDLANLRSAIIEAELTALGIAQSRIVRTRRNPADVPSVGTENQRIDIVVEQA